MALIRTAHIINSLSDALQYISAYHPPDFLVHITQAHAREKSPAARAAMEQILTNSRMAAIGRRALCQDTGTVNINLQIGMTVQFEGDLTLQEMANEAIRRAWVDADNPLRASMVADPLVGRKNTRDNTPAMLTTQYVVGDQIDVGLMAKGGGAENKTRFATLRPSDNVADWIVEQIPQMGAGWCPPGMMGVGVGGSVDVAMQMAKQALYEPLDMLDLLDRSNRTPDEQFRVDLYDRINALGIGAQGLGGLTTVLDIKLRTAPTHASAMPVALIPQCAANRVARFQITAEQGFDLIPPVATDYPQFTAVAEGTAERANLDTITQADRDNWNAGDRLLLSGKLLTGRDAAHKRIIDMMDEGKDLPVSLNGRAIYYVGPVDPNISEVVGPAGPTTSTRMDKFTPRLLAETGLGLMIGKAERGQEVIDAIRAHKTPYLAAVGGAAVLVSRAIKKARVVAFEDLGMEAIHEFEVVDMPVIVAVDCKGESIHKLGPKQWKRVNV